MERRDDAAAGQRRGPAPVLPGVDARVIARLRDRLGPDAVSDDDGVRAPPRHRAVVPRGGRAQRGEVRDPPLAVITASSREHVAETLAACAALDLSVVPFGGGTSVTGGVAGPKTPHVTLSLRGLAAVRNIDTIARVATVDAGMLGPELETGLSRDGLTLAHFRQSFERSTVGGWVATRSAGQAGTGVGAIADLVAGLRCVAPAGEIVIPAMPPSSEGPDLREAILGSEGRLGIVTDVSLRVRPAPEAADRSAWLFGSFADGLEAVRSAMQDGAAPDLVRLSDEAETTMLAKRRARFSSPASKGPRRMSRATARVSRRSAPARAHSVRSLRRAGTRRDTTRRTCAMRSSSAASSSIRSRPRRSGRTSRPCIARCGWRRADADPAGRALVLCHVSHAYATGASLYFTFVAPGGEDAVERWSSAKRAALDAMLANGAVVSHHHGIGRDHREWQARRLGPTAMSAIDSVARVLDPRRVLAANR